MSTARGWALLEALEKQREELAKRPRVISPERFQIPSGEQFGLWTVTGPTFDTKAQRADGHKKLVRNVPVKCRCGHEQSVTHSTLKAGGSLGCRACRCNSGVRAQQGADWLAKEREEGLA